MKTENIVSLILCAVAGLMPPVTLCAAVQADEPAAVSVAASENAECVEHAPHIHFDSESFDFGVIAGDTTRSHSFVMTNDGTAPLVITRVFSDCGCTTATHPDEPVMPGDTARIVVTFNPAGRSAGYFTKLVRIRSNAAPRPHRLYIKGRITRDKSGKSE